MTLGDKQIDNDSYPNLTSKTNSPKDRLDTCNQNLNTLETEKIDEILDKELNQSIYKNIEVDNVLNKQIDVGNQYRKSLGLSQVKLDEVNVYSKRKRDLDISRKVSQESFEKENSIEYNDPRIYASEDIIEYIEKLAERNIDEPKSCDYKSILKDYFLTNDKKSFFNDINEVSLQNMLQISKRQNAKFRNLSIFLTGFVSECKKWSEFKTNL